MPLSTKSMWEYAEAGKTRMFKDKSKYNQQKLFNKIKENVQKFKNDITPPYFPRRNPSRISQRRSDIKT